MKLYRETEAYKRMKEREKKRIERNAARLKSCPIHEFDVESAIKREIERRKRSQEETGVIVCVQPPIHCRCKRCGGCTIIDVAIPYMAGVRAARKEAADNLTRKGGKNNGRRQET